MKYSLLFLPYSEYTTKKQPFGDEYIVPKKNAKPIKYKISKVTDRMIMDYIEFKGLDFFKARNITINAKAGDTHFSLQWDLTL